MNQTSIFSNTKQLSLQINGSNHKTCAEGYRFGFIGMEKDNDTYGEGNAFDFGARIYDARLGRWLSCDPLANKYPHTSPFVYSLNTPIGAYDPDGKRVCFIAGAGNDKSGWNYTARWGAVFTAKGIEGFKTLNASRGSLGDMLFADTWRNHSKYEYGNGKFLYAKNDKYVQNAVNEIIDDLAKNPLKEGEQLNLAGYSYGSVMQAQIAIGLVEKGVKVDNLILAGSPTSDDSELMNTLQGLKKDGKIGNIIREDIKDDKLSNPSNVGEYALGVIESSKLGKGDDAKHFDLARPGKEADKKIGTVADKLKSKGVK